tara:strand:- start:1070 stop:1429 length:360 start_codon:yes stop_codon:yes gene_type:complete
MSKSPINFGFGAIAAGIQGIGGNKRTILRNMDQKLDRIESAVSGQGNTGTVKPVVANPEPMYQTAVEGGANNAIVNTDMVQPENLSFNAQTADAARGMFGSQIPGSFDRRMEGQEEELV